MSIVGITGTYLSGMTPKTGNVTFDALPGGDRTTAILDSTGAISLNLRATDVSPKLNDYFVTENLSSGVHTYTLALLSTYMSFDVVTSTATPYPSVGGNFQPTVTLVQGPATGTFVDSTGTYAIPAGATFITVECQAGGGGGGAGSTYSALNLEYLGAGGGGGGGKTVKTIAASILRTTYPSGIPYTVGHGGAGGAAILAANTQGANGTAGGFTFAGDFCVATPGSYYFPAQGGGTPSGFPNIGLGGSAGLGDTQGCSGGLGGGTYQYYGHTSTTDHTGTAGGYPNIRLGDAGGTVNSVVVTDAGGGGGGGGGAGGINTSVAYGGGPSGFAITANPSVIVGAGGIVGGALPTAAGAANGVTTSVQGGGGGGAASLAGNGQDGADALKTSGSGGGGGGNSGIAHSGRGGHGGSGFIRFTAT